MKKVMLVMPPIVTSGKMKDKPFFHGSQEFDKKNKRFVYSKGLIKITKEGWFRREDLVPSNMLKDRSVHERLIQGHFLAERCKVNHKFKDKMDLGFRDAEVALCALTSQTECGPLIQKLKKDVASVDCSKIPEILKSEIY
jgi:hypothetical protein